MISQNINKFNALLALGCIIKGKNRSLLFYFTSSDNGNNELIYKNQKNQLDFGILTCNNLKQAKDQLNIKKNKGKEVALGIISILKNK